jgi:hypothetical protein
MNADPTPIAADAFFIEMIDVPMRGDRRLSAFALIGVHRR